MPTVWQGEAALTPATAGSVTEAARMISKANFITAANISGALETLFNLLQAMIDAEEVDNPTREHAIMLLLAYHAATISNDKYTAVKAIKRVERDALLLLDHAWNVFGVTGVPIHRPSRYQIAEWMKLVGKQRSSNSLNTMPGPSSY